MQVDELKRRDFITRRGGGVAAGPARAATGQDADDRISGRDDSGAAEPMDSRLRHATLSNPGRD